MKPGAHVPMYVAVVSVVLGCVDLIRGFMHTIRVEHAARDIAGLDLSSPVAIDLLTLMVAFGISNFLTGVMLILTGLWARRLALVMLAVVPTAYFIGFIGLQLNSATYAPTQADYPGKQMLAVYMVVCVATFVAATTQTGIVALRTRPGPARGC